MNIIAKKIKEDYYEQILKGDKRFEIRKEDDCKYYTNDILILKEINVSGEYTGRIAICKISCVLRDFEGLADNYVALGIKIIKTHDFEIGETR